jgi:multimeric flavodoxin WrbA
MKALLLVGSPRKEKSASETLGAYLLGGLEAQGADARRLYVYPALRSEERLDALIGATAAANVVIISAPLYVDALPAAVTELLEILYLRLDDHQRPEEQRLVAISNCGFPEAEQNDIALQIYRSFARQAGFTWAGGLAIGGGEMVKGRPLEESGGMARNVIAALDLAAEALAEGKSIPQEAVDLMAKPLAPAWIYRAMGNVGWHIQALQKGTWRQLRARAWKGTASS